MIRILKNIYHLIRAVIANYHYDYPGRKLKIIGVTGTDGKTTTSSLIYHLLKTTGKKVSMISSVYAMVGGTEYDTGFHVTSPDAFAIQKYLKMSVDAGDEYFVLETTSHGLDQNRVWGIPFEIGVLTNITNEHLDYHKSYDHYVAAKTKLFLNSKVSLLNADDDSYDYVHARLRKAQAKTGIYSYGLQKPADFHYDISAMLGVPLADFNKYNYLAAAAVGKIIRLADQSIYEALRSFQLPAGRVEFIIKEPCTIVVDFAHTPHAVESILKYLRYSHLEPTCRLIHVFGSAAERDVLKRPVMGEMSATYSDYIIITEEDYRTEDPHKIAYEIATGIQRKDFKHVESPDFGMEPKTYTIIIDRKEAIEKAMSIAKEGDIIVLTGKGHEKSLCRGTTEYPWNDKQAVLDLLKTMEPQTPVS